MLCISKGNWRLLNKVEDYYSPQYICESASGRVLYGRNQFINYVLSLLSAFPNLAVSIDNFCALHDQPGRYRSATRWQSSMLESAFYLNNRAPLVIGRRIIRVRYASHRRQRHLPE